MAPSVSEAKEQDKKNTIEQKKKEESEKVDESGTTKTAEEPNSSKPSSESSKKKKKKKKDSSTTVENEKENGKDSKENTDEKESAKIDKNSKEGVGEKESNTAPDDLSNGPVVSASKRTRPPYKYDPEKVTLRFLFANRDGLTVTVECKPSDTVGEVKGQLLSVWPEGTLWKFMHSFLLFVKNKLLGLTS